MPQIYQPQGIIPYVTEKYRMEDDPNRRLYNQQQWEAFRREPWFREDGWVVYQLGRHEITDEISAFRGWTPSYDFENSGFKREAKIDLLQVGKIVEAGSIGSCQVVRDNNVTVKEVTAEDLAYGRKYAGTAELLERQRNEINDIFKRFHEQEIDFVVFRTFRGWPAVWDNVYFYSPGKFMLRD